MSAQRQAAAGGDINDSARTHDSCWLAPAREAAPARPPASPALLAGLALMPLVIAAGLLRERVDTPADPGLRPTLAICADADCRDGPAPVSLAASASPRGGAGSSMVRAGRS